MIKTSVALIGVSAIISGASAVGVAIDNAESSDTTLHANSAYQLELANGTTNVFNITKYLENAETGELTPQVYNVVFNKQLGNADATGDQVKYFSWEKDTENGGYKLVAGTSDSYDLKVGLGDDVYVKQFNGESGVVSIKPDQEVSSFLGTFVGNSSGSDAGVIMNEGTINNLVGHFIGNSSGLGGAIHNFGTIDSLTGDFIGNYAFGGGGIRNDRKIGSVTGNFIGNSANYGGAIENASGTIDSITGDFINNSVSSSGGAIENYNGTIHKINGNFIDNSASSGGAINNDGGTIATVTGDFIGNSASGNGGAIDNSNGTIGSIIGDFVKNSATSSGGAIYNNDGKIGAITGDFISNASGAYQYGGAIYNSNGTIGSIIGDFVKNSATSYGGAIYNKSGTIDSITGDFIKNSAYYAGAIYNKNGTIGTITGDFIGNSISGWSYGGAIYNDGSTIDTINGNFIGNTSYIGGAIANMGSTIATITGDFIGNFGTASAGAIYTTGNIGLLAKDRSMEFTGNTADRPEYVRSEAIFIDGSKGKVNVNMNAYGSNKIVLNDGIRGLYGTTVGNRVVNINNGLAGDGSKIDAAGKSFGTVEFNNDVKELTINVLAGTLKAGSHKGGVIDLGSGKFVTTKNSIAKFVGTDIKVADNAKLLIGADVNGNSPVYFHYGSNLSLENGATLAFEENSSIKMYGNLSAENSTLFFELSDYVSDLEGDETFDLDWTFATFENADAAADALAGFGNFGNDLGILKGDKDSEGLWFDVVQNGNELKVVGVIPEPATIGLLGLVGGALLAVRRRFCA